MSSLFKLQKWFLHQNGVEFKPQIQIWCVLCVTGVRMGAGRPKTWENMLIYNGNQYYWLWVQLGQAPLDESLQRRHLPPAGIRQQEVLLRVQRHHNLHNDTRAANEPSRSLKLYNLLVEATNLVDALAWELCPALLTHPHRAILAAGQDGALGRGNTEEWSQMVQDSAPLNCVKHNSVTLHLLQDTALP